MFTRGYNASVFTKSDDFDESPPQKTAPPSRWSPQPPNLLGGFNDLPNPGLIGYSLQALERIDNEALAGET